MENGPDYLELLERVGDMIYTLDLEGRFTYVNAAGTEIFGYPPAELIGRDFREFLEPTSAHIAIEHFTRGLAGTLGTPFFEVRILRSDGAVIDIEVRAGSLYRDGALIGRQGVARDISTLKRLQAEVAEKSQRLALLEDQAQIAMDLYRRIADLTLAPPLHPGGSGGSLREVEAALARITAEKLGLDAQDIEIVELLAAGQSNREIGAQVHLSPNTVKDRVSKLMRIFGARRRAEVVAQAAHHGLISRPR
jgi:PAS domain S-box-containing protein